MFEYRHFLQVLIEERMSRIFFPAPNEQLHNNIQSSLSFWQMHTHLISLQTSKIIFALELFLANLELGYRDLTDLTHVFSCLHQIARLSKMPEARILEDD